MKLKAIVPLICLFFLGSAQAQEDAYSLTDLHPVSPTAFQFMKYTEMPVSQYTGIPDISVPLYEINVDGLKLPINLTYHSRGINVMQEASWVGLGWDLQMGSLIQTINDRDDYGIDGSQGPYMKVLPDYFPSNGDGSPVVLPMEDLDPIPGVHGAGWSDPYPINQPQPMQGYAIATDYYIPVQGEFGVQRSELFTNEHWDSEPDFFVASFPEGPIKFVLDFKNGNRIAVLNKLNYVVTKTTAGFRITAPTGNSYYFETVSHILNVTSGEDMTGQFGGHNMITGDTVSHIFFLSRIVTKNKKIVSFNYASTASSYNGYPIESEKQQALALIGTTDNSDLVYGDGNYYSWDNTPGNPWQGAGTYPTISQNIEKYCYLQSITFPTGRLDFYLSARSDMNGGQKLDSVHISNSSGTLIKTWQLDYSYFNSSSVGGNGYSTFSGDTLSTNPISLLRLELLDVKERGPGGAVYSFGYDSTLLPKKNSYAADYWGYYNGALTNTSFVPDPTAVGMSSLGDNGNNKNANGTYAQACILQSIQYPTGGKATFEYELNQLNTDQMLSLQPTNSTIQGDGLRIHAINHLNSDGSQATRSIYLYGTGRQINFTPLLQQCNYTLWNGTDAQGGPITQNYTLTQISVNGVFGTNPMASIDGVGYDEVTKEDVDAFGNTIGRTVTTFNNTEDVHNPTIYSRVVHCTIPTVRSITSPENGCVATQTKYDAQGNMVEDLSNTYQMSPSMIYYGARPLPYTGLYYAANLDGSGITPVNRTLVGYFPIYDVQTLLSRTDDTVFYANGPMSTRSAYNYDGYYNQLSAKSTSRSDGGTDYTNYYYPYNTTNSSPIFQIMVDSNRLLDIVTLQKETNSSILKYQYDRSFEQIGNLILESKAVIQNNPIPHGSPNFPDSVTYDVYDPSTSDLLQMTSKGVTDAYIWDYGKNYVVADVKNALSSQIAYTSFEADGTGNWVYTGTATADASSPTGSLCYNLGQTSGGISSPSLNSGTAYVVSYWVKGTNALSISGTIAGFPVQGKTINGWTYYEHKVTGVTSLTISGSVYIDELRLYPATAQMTTCTYMPLIGVSSECDVDDRITYYSYDALGRLNVVKDQDGNIVKTYQYHYKGQ